VQALFARRFRSRRAAQTLLQFEASHRLQAYRMHLLHIDGKLQRQCPTPGFSVSLDPFADQLAALGAVQPFWPSSICLRKAT